MTAIGALFIPTLIACMVIWVLSSIAELVMDGLWKRVASDD